MGFLQLFITALMVFTYATSIAKHGDEIKPAEDVSKTARDGALVITFLIFHGLYFWGDFYTNIGTPQVVLMFWDAMWCAFYTAKKMGTTRYNAYRTILDAGVTFSCLWAGGFYSGGIHQM